MVALNSIGYTLEELFNLLNYDVRKGPMLGECEFNLLDTFQNRIHLIFLHVSFLFIKVNQEKKNNEDIKKFCEVNFNINFPLSTITKVKGNSTTLIIRYD